MPAVLATGLPVKAAPNDQHRRPVKSVRQDGCHLLTLLPGRLLYTSSRRVETGGLDVALLAELAVSSRAVAIITASTYFAFLPRCM